MAAFGSTFRAGDSRFEKRMMDFVFKMMRSALKTMKSVLKTMILGRPGIRTQPMGRRGTSSLALILQKVMTNRTRMT